MAELTVVLQSMLSDCDGGTSDPSIFYSATYNSSLIDCDLVFSSPILVIRRNMGPLFFSASVIM